MTPEGKAASLTAREIHDFIENPPAEGVYEGDAQKAADLYANARGNYSAAKRAETWEGAQYRASIASNAGVDALRTQVRALLRNPKRISSFTPESRQAMEQFVRGGSLLEKGLRNVGPWVGHGGALLTGAEMIGSAIRGEAASPFMSALQAGGSEAVGQMLKHRLPDYLAERAFQKIGEGERKRSPLYQHTAPPPLSPFNTGEVARGLGALQGVVQDQDNGG
jgi:hypothetical protein